MKLLDTKVYKMRNAEDPKSARIDLKVPVYVNKDGDFICMLPQYLDEIGESIISRHLFAVGLLMGIEVENKLVEKAYCSTNLNTLSEFIQSCIKSYDTSLFEKKVKDEKVILVEFENRIPSSFRVCIKNLAYIDEYTNPVYSYKSWDPQEKDTSFLANLAKLKNDNNNNKFWLEDCTSKDYTSYELNCSNLKELSGTEENAEYFLLVFSFLANMKIFLLPSDWWYYVDSLKNKNPIEKKLESLRIINKEIQKK